MTTCLKRFALVALGVVLVYALTPFVAGLVGTYDRRGPKIFAESHHELLYMTGYSLFHDDKPRVPYMRERSWFYGVAGTPIPKRGDI
jgi:hypothetical protein